MREPVIQHYFPTTVYMFENKQLAKELLLITKQCLSNPNFCSRELSYDSTFTSALNGKNLVQYEQYFEFKNFLMQNVCNYHSMLGYDELRVQNVLLFASKMTRGDTHRVHVHPNSLYSSIFYLSVPEGSSPITFYDPRPQNKFIERKKKANTKYNYRDFSIVPYDGLLLIWESWLEHEVPTNNCEDDRITLVSNISNLF